MNPTDYGRESSTEILYTMAIAINPCAMTTISVILDQPLSDGAQGVFTLRVGTTPLNLADQPLTCTIDSGGQTCSATGSVPIAASNLFNIKAEPIGGPFPGSTSVLTAMACQ